MAKDLFTEEQQAQIRTAIQEAEKHTSGEIKVHIENTCKDETLDRAAYIFEELKMHKTNLRNGVLFYLALKDRQFAILGDIGINSKVPDGFWDQVSNLMLNFFKKAQFTEGLVEGVIEAGKQLGEHFPLASDDKNELSDDVSFGND